MGFRHDSFNDRKKERKALGTPRATSSHYYGVSGESRVVTIDRKIDRKKNQLTAYHKTLYVSQYMLIILQILS